MNTLPPKKTPRGGETQGGGGTTGGGGGGGGGNGTTNLAPGLTKLKLSRASFRRGKSTTISFRLSEAAKVTLSFERKQSGRRVHGRCVKLAKGKRANCTRYTRVSSVMSFQGKAGTNKVTFRGKLGRKSLALGSYRLTLQAKDSTGKRSAKLRTSFKLMESASQSQARAVRAIALGWL